MQAWYNNSWLAVVHVYVECEKVHHAWKYSIMAANPIMFECLDTFVVIPIWRECSIFFLNVYKVKNLKRDHWLVDIISTIIRWPGEHVTRRETVYHCCCDCFIFYRNNDFFWRFYMNDGCMLQNGLNTIIVNVFLSTKLNDNHQVDTMDAFQSKDFVIFFAFHVPLFASFLHILYWR